MKITLSKKEFKKAVSDYVKTYYDENVQISNIQFSNFERYVSVGEIDLIIKKKPKSRSSRDIVTVTEQNEKDSIIE